MGPETGTRFPHRRQVAFWRTQSLFVSYCPTETHWRTTHQIMDHGKQHTRKVIPPQPMCVSWP